MPIPATFQYNRLGIGVFGGVVGTERSGKNADLLGCALSKNIPRKGGQDRDLSTALRFGRNNKGKGGASWERGLEQKAFFTTLGGPQGHDSSGGDDNLVAKIRSRAGVTGTERSEVLSHKTQSLI